MLCMLYELIGAHSHYKEAGTLDDIFYIHGAQDGLHHPGRAEVESLRDSAQECNLKVTVHTAYTRPLKSDTGYNSVGRVDASLISHIVGDKLARSHVYCCGPADFMASLGKSLQTKGLDPSRYH